jgi:hypothetical protein
MNPVASAWRFAESTSHRLHETPPLDKFPEFTDVVNYIAFENNEDFAYIAEFADRLYFAISGTKNLRAWIGDFDAFPLKDPNPEKYLVYTNDSTKQGYIHNDFYTSWLNFKPTFQEYLQRFAQDKTGQKPDRKSRLGEIWKDNKLPPVIYVAHSRGSALAALAARDAAKNLGISCSCFAFGSPRVGTKQFREEMNALPVDYLNVHHGYEFAKYLPPEFAGFRDAGRALDLREPWWPPISRKITDHYYTTTTDALGKYSKQKQDAEGAHWMYDIVRKRCTI